MVYRCTGGFWVMRSKEEEKKKNRLALWTDKLVGASDDQGWGTVSSSWGM